MHGEVVSLFLEKEKLGNWSVLGLTSIGNSYVIQETSLVHLTKSAFPRLFTNKHGYIAV